MTDKTKTQDQATAPAVDLNTMVSLYDDESRFLSKKRIPTKDELDKYLAAFDFDEVEKLKYFIDNEQEFGQSYEKHAVFGIKCPVCGSKEFNVGYSSYLTICKCVKCKTIVHTHDG